MKTTNKNLFDDLYGALFVMIFLLIATTSQAENLRGPAFLRERKTIEMEKGWVDKTIQPIHTDQKADLVVDINQQLFPALKPIVQEYGRMQGIKITVVKSTCGKSSGRISRKEVDIGSFCCPPGANDHLPGLRYHTLGVSPLAILTYPENPIKSITLTEARRIFQGEIENWSEVGGSSTTIKPISSLHCPSRPGHWRLLLANKDQFSTGLMVVEDMTDQISLLSSTNGSIGYETLWVAERFRKKGEVKALEIDGLHPKDLQHVTSGAYSLYRVYNVTTWEGKNIDNPHAGKLIQYLMKQVEEFGSKYGLVPASQLRKAGWKFNNNELVGESNK